MTDRRKPKAADKIFGREAKESMRKAYLAEKCVGISKNVRKIAEHLLLDDRLYCDYAKEKERLDDEEVTVIYTGFFRGYDPTEDAIFVSPYTDSTELGLLKIASKKIGLLKWSVEKVKCLYIEKPVEERIVERLKTKSKESGRKR